MNWMCIIIIKPLTFYVGAPELEDNLCSSKILMMKEDTYTCCKMKIQWPPYLTSESVSYLTDHKEHKMMI